MARKVRTPAFKTFLENMAEVRRLLQIHGQLGGPGPGRRWGTEVLNKSAVVLLVACWEAYLEDVASFAFSTALSRCQEPRRFPKEVIRRVGQSLRDVRDERAIWNLAGSGWKDVLSNYRTKTIEKFHNPNSSSVDDFFLRVLGMKSLSKCWHWAGMSVARAKGKLDRIVNTRGSIAHRVQHSSPVHLATVKNYQGHIGRLVRRTDLEIRKTLKIV
jgi:RiboL-PSP-HEPN